MKLQALNKNILLSDCENFDPFISCECGQYFRFVKNSDIEYSIFACGRRLNIEKTAEGWLFLDISEDDFKRDFIRFFDLERDYKSIIDGFSNDSVISQAAKSRSGIRIFRQDGWETLISFIISQNNNIPRIKKIIESLCRLLGNENGGVYSFPAPEAVLNAGIEGLAPIKSGFRAKYIIDAAEKVLSGEVNLETIAEIGYENALCELKKIKGVGDKVANCVLLFGFGYYEAFPIDVWVKRVIEKYYPNGLDPKTLGKYAGIAQQYLFDYERNHIE